jgi:cell division protein FtsL
MTQIKTENPTKSNQKWFQTNKFIIPLILVLILLFAFGIILINKQINNKTENTETENNSAISSTSSKKEELKPSEPEKTDFRVGEVINKLDKQLIITKVDIWNSENQFIKPKPGKQFIKVSLELKNNSSNIVSLNPFDYKVEDFNGLQLGPDSSSYSLDDKLDSGNLAQNGKVSGSLIFEIPTGDKTAKLIYEYQPSFWSKKTINIKLF